jgi:hypothetical protein
VDAREGVDAADRDRECREVAVVVLVVYRFALYDQTTASVARASPAPLRGVAIDAV